MIFNDEFCFIHVPKTAGMALSKYFLNNLINRPVHYTVPPGHGSEEEKSMKDVIFHEFGRHKNLIESEIFLNSIDRSLKDFKCVLTFMRNPYDMEVSRYHYLQKGHSWDKGKASDIAINNSFDVFAKNAPFFGKPIFDAKNYYTLEGKSLLNMKILHFEDLNEQIKKELDEYLDVTNLPEKVNATKRKLYEEYMNPSIEIAIYKKYQWVFDNGFYQREKF